MDLPGAYPGESPAPASSDSRQHHKQLGHEPRGHSHTDSGIGLADSDLPKPSISHEPKIDDVPRQDQTAQQPSMNPHGEHSGLQSMTPQDDRADLQPPPPVHETDNMSVSPGWSNLPIASGGGIYNTVTGHGSEEDNHLQRHHASPTEEATNKPADISTIRSPTAEYPPGGVYNTVTGYGSDEAKEHRGEEPSSSDANELPAERHTAVGTSKDLGSQPSTTDSHGAVRDIDPARQHRDEAQAADNEKNDDEGNRKRGGLFGFLHRRKESKDKAFSASKPTEDANNGRNKLKKEPPSRKGTIVAKETTQTNKKKEDEEATKAKHREAVAIIHPDKGDEPVDNRAMRDGVNEAAPPLATTDRKAEPPSALSTTERHEETEESKKSQVPPALVTAGAIGGAGLAASELSRKQDEPLKPSEEPTPVEPGPSTLAASDHGTQPTPPFHTAKRDEAMVETETSQEPPVAVKGSGTGTTPTQSTDPEAPYKSKFNETAGGVSVAGTNVTEPTVTSKPTLTAASDTASPRLATSETAIPETAAHETAAHETATHETVAHETAAHETAEPAATSTDDSQYNLLPSGTPSGIKIKPRNSVRVPSEHVDTTSVTAPAATTTNSKVDAATALEEDGPYNKLSSDTPSGINMG